MLKHSVKCTIFASLKPFSFSYHTGLFLHGIDYGNESSDSHLSLFVLIPGGVSYRKVDTRDCNVYANIATKLKKTK